MTIPTLTLWTPPKWYAAIPDLLCVLAVPVLLKIWWWCINNSPESGTWVRSCLDLLCWRAVCNLYPPNRSWFYPSSCPKRIRQTRHGGTPFGGWGCVLYRAGVSPGKRASPSTCRVWTLDWQVRGLCWCLWYARGLCLCPCVITPRGFTSLPTQEAEYSFSGFIPTNKQTNKKTGVQWWTAQVLSWCSRAAKICVGANPIFRDSQIIYFSPHNLLPIIQADLGFLCEGRGIFEIRNRVSVATPALPCEGDVEIKSDAGCEWSR